MKELNNINNKVFFTILGGCFLALLYTLDVFVLRLLFHDQNVLMFFVLLVEPMVKLERKSSQQLIIWKNLANLLII